jgi:modification methylase
MRAAPIGAIEATPSRRDTPRVAFGSLVERGLVQPGAQLVDRQRRVAATVMADGTIQCGPHRGSIHQVGAAVTNAPSCNGWMFWFTEVDGVLVEIDGLRKK